LEQAENFEIKKEKYFSGFYNQVISGIKYYREIASPSN
jgi:hypothetical protein